MVKNLEILVIGDACKDVFIYCDAKRLAPDLPIPVLNVVRQTENPGMAANVFRNIEKLSDGKATLRSNDGWENVTKTRYVDEKSNHHFLRVDSLHIFEPFKTIKSELNFFDVIAISDYNKGFLTEDTIREICEYHPCVFIDTKKPIKDFAKSAKYIKINDFEYKNSLPLTWELSEKIIHTAGENGCYFGGKHFPVNKVEVKDVSGAGDSFFAALVVMFAKTRDIEHSIEFANSIASEVVKHRGVT